MAADFLLTPATPLLLPTLRTLLASNARVVAAEEHGSASAPSETTAPLLAAACGVGPEVPGELVRLLLLLHAGQQQRLGASAATVRRLLDFYNREVLPVVYQQGGDQAGLAHLSLPLFGLGEVNYQGYRLQAHDVLELFGWAPLPHTNAAATMLMAGSAFTLAHAVWAWLRAERLVWVADSLSSQAQAVLRGHTDALPATSHPAWHTALAYAQQAIEEGSAALPTLPEQPAVADTAATSMSLALRTLLLTVAEVGRHSAQRTEHLLGSAAPTLAGLHRPVASLLQQSMQLCTVASADSVVGVALHTQPLLDTLEQLLGIELVLTSQQLPAQLPATAQLLLDARSQLPPLVEHQPVYPVVHAAAQFVRRYARPA